MEVEKLSLDAFVDRYCKQQEMDPVYLREILVKQRERFNPDGWMLLECHVLDGSFIGQLGILPYGPNNTYKSVPNYPISLRGLASDMSVVVAVMDKSEMGTPEAK